MSLLRQRAMEVSAESTLRAGSPRLVRAWLVRATSCDSAAELKELASQPSARPGAAKRPRALSTNAMATRPIQRLRACPAARTGPGWWRDVSIGDRGLLDPRTGQSAAVR